MVDDHDSSNNTDKDNKPVNLPNLSESGLLRIMTRGRGQAKCHRNGQPNNNTGGPPSTCLNNQNCQDREATNQGQNTAKSGDTCKQGFRNKCGRPVTEDNEALQCDSCNL
ncbi:hypothetical protein SK128_008319 [Halocaridina rubra]|uniref:Uncharacterized protein n=1 Tax=Halocaridina rubra TaxID=373956 RepID=A0AAN8XEA2_HALRR